MNRARERGQATVEMALMAPMTIFIILGILQLGMMQHAQLLTEYAAFTAARAGIVHNGNPDEMKKSAFLSLMPTFSRVYHGNQTLPRVILKLNAYSQFGPRAFLLGEAAKWEDYGQSSYIPGDAVAQIAANNSFDFIKIETIKPSTRNYASLGRNVWAGHTSNEIDFDDVSSANAVSSNILSIRLTYYYVMRVPFANWALHNFWVAANAQVPHLLNLRRAPELIEGYGKDQSQYRVLASTSGDLRTLKLLAISGLYVFPLQATHTLRMQSNQFKKYLP